MESDNLIHKKAFQFSVKVIKEYKRLSTKNNEYVLSKQLLRSGTSIGANLEEAIGAVSSKDFFHKISISYKEAREARYWIRLLFESGYLEKNISSELICDIEEILRILTSIQKTLKSKMK